MSAATNSRGNGSDPTSTRPLRFLVAGAAGFIGSHLSERLLQLGHSVTGVDNLMTGSLRNLDPFLDHPRFRFIEHDVIQPVAVEGRLDWILHFASPASPPKYQQFPIRTLRVNAEGAFHLLELARRRGAGLLFASTSEVYGDPSVHPQPESYWGNVNPVGPRSMYDEAKRYAEALVTSYHKSHGIPVRLIRIFNTYGPRMREDDGRVIVNFVRQALAGRPLTVYGDGRQTRSFQYVDDLVDAVLRLLRVDYTGPVNLGNPEEFTMLELAQVIRDLTGSGSPLAFRPLPQDDPRQRRPEIGLAERLLEWRPRVSLREGLAPTIRYFREVPAQSTAPAGMAVASGLHAAPRVAGPRRARRVPRAFVPAARNAGGRP